MSIEYLDIINDGVCMYTKFVLYEVGTELLRIM